MRKQSMKKGIVIMSISNIVNKVMGALYIILLVPLIGNSGMGLLNNAQYIYNLFIIAFTSGMSPALAKIISENYSQGKNNQVKQIFSVCLKAFFIVGLAAGVLMYLLSFVFTIDKNAMPGIYALMPALVFTGISVVFRAYLQGIRYMLPIALAQLADQIAKISISLLLIFILLPDTKLAAFGGAVGIASGAFFSMMVYVLVFLRIRGGMAQEDELPLTSAHNAGSQNMIKLILSYAVPISIGGALIQAIGLMDLTLFKRIFPDLGYSITEVNNMFGIYSAQVVKLIDIPAVFTMAISANMLPAVAASFGSGQKEDIRRKTYQAYRLATLVSIPAAVGLAVLSEPVIKLAFGSQGSTELGGHALRIMACAIVFISIAQVSTAILQGINRIYRPVRNILIGLLLKAVFSSLLFVIPAYGMQILAAGTVICYMTAAVLDILDVRKYTGMDSKVFKSQLRFFISALVMGVFVAFTYKYAIRLSGSNLLGLCTAIPGGILVYGIMVLATGEIRGEEIQSTLISGRRKPGRVE